MTNALHHTRASRSLIATPAVLARQIKRLESVLACHQRFVVTAHAGPDGDAIGSTLAMGLFLEQLGKDVVFYNEDPVPYNLAFLPGADRITPRIPAEFAPDATVVLDCGERHRVGDRFPGHGWGREVIVVDHHKTFDPGFATVWVQDVGASATGEILFRVINRLGHITPEIAQSLYCCLMTDTGSFRYSNTSRVAFRMAGELVALGVEPWHMTSQIYENQPRERLELLCKVLGTLKLSPCGRLAFLRVEDGMLDGPGDVGNLTDGFINYARSVQGVEVAIQLRGVCGDDWRVSFRSRGKVDVSALAARFGGGGHHNAAGCNMNGSPDAIMANLSSALVELLGH